MHNGGHHHGPMHSMNMSTDAMADMSHDMPMNMPMDMKMDMKMEMMATSFHLDPKLTLLFEFWRPESSSDVYLSYLILFSMGLIYEANKFFQLLFLQKFAPAEYNLACLSKLELLIIRGLLLLSHDYHIERYCSYFLRYSLCVLSKTRIIV